MATTTPNYNINYDDERFAQVESEKSEALTDLEQTYGGMVGESDKYYQAQIDASKDWADKQQQLQQEQTDFTIEQIEQQKDKAHKDYLKEQSGAYVDWQKQSNQYGSEAEKMASAGLDRTGFSESSQVSMYNTYQNRMMSARETYNQAVLNYDNSIKDARLQNNAVLAEIAYQALQQQLELSLQGFQYKNQLLLDQYDKKMQVQNMYHQQWLDVLNQMNTENALAEQVRQFNEGLVFEAEQKQLDRDHDATQAQLDRDFQAQQSILDRQHDEKIQKLDQQFKAAQAELDRKHDIALQNAKTKAEKEMLEIQHKNDLAKLAQQHKNDKEILDKQLANEKALLKYQNEQKSVTIGGGSSGSSGSSGSKAGSGSMSLSDVIGTFDKNGTYQNKVSTPYYQGSLNSDAKKYGTFSNGYQPKGISGHGKLSKTGDTLIVNTEIKYGANKGQKQSLEQTIWKAADGTYWYWEGRENKYKSVPKSALSSGNLLDEVAPLNAILNSMRGKS